MSVTQSNISSGGRALPSSPLLVFAVFVWWILVVPVVGNWNALLASVFNPDPSELARAGDSPWVVVLLGVVGLIPMVFSKPSSRVKIMAAWVVLGIVITGLVRYLGAGLGSAWLLALGGLLAATAVVAVYRARGR